MGRAGWSNEWEWGTPHWHGGRFRPCGGLTVICHLGVVTAQDRHRRPAGTHHDMAWRSLAANLNLNRRRGDAEPLELRAPPLTPAAPAYDRDLRRGPPGRARAVSAGENHSERPTSPDTVTVTRAGRVRWGWRRSCR